MTTLREKLKVKSTEFFRIISLIALLINSLFFFQEIYFKNLLFIFIFSFGLVCLIEFLIYKKWNVAIDDALKLVYYSFILSFIIPQNIPVNSVWMASLLMSGVFYLQIKSKKCFISPPLIALSYILFTFYSNFYFPQFSMMLERHSNLFPDVITSSTPYTQYFKSGEAYGFQQIFSGFIMGTPSEIFLFSTLCGLFLLIAHSIISYRIVFTALITYSVSISVAHFFKIQIYDNSIIQSIPYYLIISPTIFSIIFLLDDGFISPETKNGKFIYGFLFGILSLVLKKITNSASYDAYLIIILALVIKIPEYLKLKKNKQENSDINNAVI